MNLCQRCWANGRSLQLGECFCTDSVLKPSDFHAWMGSKVPPLPDKPKDASKPVYVQSKTRLVFGEKINSKKDKR